MEQVKLQTRIALVWGYDRFFISFEVERWNRERLRSEGEKYNPYELFVNNRCPADMMRAVEEIQPDDYDMMMLGGIPISPFPPNANRILASLYSGKPTRTDLKNAQDLIKKWGKEDKESDILPSSTIDLASLMRASRDLNAACKLLLYSLDECSENSVDETLPHLPQMRKENCHDRVGAYYERLLLSPQSELNFSSSISKTIEDSFGEKAAIGLHARSMFNTMLSGASPQFGVHGEAKLTNSPHDALVGIWLHFAEGIQDGKVAVCANCDRIFFKKRSTGKYCSRSCAVMGSKNK